MSDSEIKHFLGQKYEEIKRECLSNGTLWKDDRFPASDQSLYRFKKPKYDIVWKRPGEFLQDKAPEFIVNDIACGDIDQGQIGDCWFLSALANVADVPEYINKVIPRDQSFQKGQYAGIFRFRFWQYGQWVEVCVDDRLPYMEEYKSLYGARNRADTQEMFAALLEKAYAKLNLTYEFLIGGGEMSDALTDLTGGVSETYILPNKANAKKEAMDIDSLWPIIFKSFQFTAPKTLCAASTLSNDPSVTSLGLVSFHAYTVMDVYELKGRSGKYDAVRAPNERIDPSVKTIRLVRMRNPWGKDESYTGRWSKGSAEWSQVSADVRAKIKADDQVDGLFFMSFEDFCRLFGNIQFVNLNMNVFYADLDQLQNPNIVWKSESYFSQFKPGVSSYGRFDNSDGFFTGNPQFLIVVKSNLVEPTVSTVISVTQVVSNEAKMAQQKNDAYQAINIQIFKVKNPAPELTSNFEIADNKYTKNELQRLGQDLNYEYVREKVKRIELEPGVYVIIPNLFEGNVEERFLLRLYYEQAASASKRKEKPVEEVEQEEEVEEEPVNPKYQNQKMKMPAVVSTITTVDEDEQPIMQRQEISQGGIVVRSGACVIC